MCERGLDNITKRYLRIPHDMKKTNPDIKTSNQVVKTLHDTQQRYYEHLQHFIEYVRAQESKEWDRAYLEGLTMKNGGQTHSDANSLPTK